MISPKYSFIIWDFHGTMTDNQLRTIRAYHTAAKKVLGVKFDKTFYQEVLTRPAHQQRDEKGLTHNEFIGQLFSSFQFCDFIDDEQAFLREFHAAMDKTYLAIPGVKKVINLLHDSGLKMAVCTNKPDKERIKTLLDQWGLVFLSDRIYNQQDSGVKKPHPEALLKIFRDMRQKGLSVAPETSLLIGDHTTDIYGAANIGMDSVLIAAGSPGISSKLKEPFPTFVIAEPKELLSIVAGKTPSEPREEITLAQTLWKNETWLTYKER